MFGTLFFQSRNRIEKSDAGKEEVSKTEDVLVKVVRVIANISINETVGPQVASSNLCVELLIRILGTV